MMRWLYEPLKMWWAPPTKIISALMLKCRCGQQMNL